MAASVLRTLRLNCLLAALVPAVAASAGLAAAWWAAEERVAGLRAGEALSALETWARQGAIGKPVPPEAWREADPRWLGLAEIVWDGDALGCSASAGSLTLDPLAPPAWVAAAVHRPHAERRGGRLVMATPMFSSEGRLTAIAWGETAVPSGIPVSWLIATVAAVLAIAGAMAVYLAQRISGPVLAIQRYAEAAAAGRAMPEIRETSVETLPLRRSVESLVEQSRSGQRP
jgi:hypothetical protein